jgi:hypothetical protein
MDFQFLFNPFRNSIGNRKQIIQQNETIIEGGRIGKYAPLPINMKHFQPIVRTKTKGGSLTKSNNIRMIF